MGRFAGRQNCRMPGRFENQLDVLALSLRP